MLLPSSGLKESFSCCQVGNAVPPPLSRAIGLEIKKCVTMRMKQEQASGECRPCEARLNVEQFYELKSPVCRKCQTGEDGAL